MSDRPLDKGKDGGLSAKQKGVIAGSVIALVMFFATEIPGVLDKVANNTWSEFIFRNSMSHTPTLALLFGAIFTHLTCNFGQPETYQRDFFILLGIVGISFLVDLTVQLIHRYNVGEWYIYHPGVIAAYAAIGACLGLLLWRQDSLRTVLGSGS